MRKPARPRLTRKEPTMPTEKYVWRDYDYVSDIFERFSETKRDDRGKVISSSLDVEGLITEIKSWVNPGFGTMEADWGDCCSKADLVVRYDIVDEYSPERFKSLVDDYERCLTIYKEKKKEYDAQMVVYEEKMKLYNEYKEAKEAARVAKRIAQIIKKSAKKGVVLTEDGVKELAKAGILEI